MAEPGRKRELRDARVTPLAEELPHEADALAREAIESIGRTEDVRFAPSNDRLAIAAYGRDALVLVDLEIQNEAADAPPAIRLTRVTELTSPVLAEPHGLDFVDEETIIVASRAGQLAVLGIRSDSTGRPCALVPAASKDRVARLSSPGSLAVVSGPQGAPVALVCDNACHTITRHQLEATADGWALVGSEVLVDRWLDIPDGVAATDRWLAVSNHTPQSVLVYDRAMVDGGDQVPRCVLRGVRYPHGLRFTADGQHLLVADAGAPYVHLYDRPGAAWSGVLHPRSSLRVMDEETFDRGQANPQEGGPKGLDIDRTGRVAAITSAHQALVFLGVHAIVERATASAADDALQVELALEQVQLGLETRRSLVAADRRVAEASAIADAERLRADEALKEAATAAHLGAVRAHAAALGAAAAEEHLAAIQRTLTFRALGPLRRLYGAVRRIRISTSGSGAGSRPGG